MSTMDRLGRDTLVVSIVTTVRYFTPTLTAGTRDQPTLHKQTTFKFLVVVLRLPLFTLLSGVRLINHRGMQTTPDLH